ncbi:hypothetical protein DFH07DRAFT_777358 [Mycena maculata]|uniref:Uncharacterized protein n=1 Tax=Mycena maculata TaxID=230809 RepID=A0AAD7IHS9_9AGAR|nr:hypothetical protein DFH07DRAFT_777358 [Mycena maculata]
MPTVSLEMYGDFIGSESELGETSFSRLDDAIGRKGRSRKKEGRKEAVTYTDALQSLRSEFAVNLRCGNGGMTERGCVRPLIGRILLLTPGSLGAGRSGCDYLSHLCGGGGSWEQSRRKETPKLCMPEESAAPLIDSDFSQYLHKRGWHLQVNTVRRYGSQALLRIFEFPDFKALVAFTSNTQDSLAGDLNISLCATAKKHPRAHLWVNSPAGVARSTLPSAMEKEITYRKLVSHDAVPSRWQDSSHLQSFNRLENQVAKILALIEFKTTGNAGPLTPPAQIHPVSLPPAQERHSPG